MNSSSDCWTNRIRTVRAPETKPLPQHSRPFRVLLRTTSHKKNNQQTCQRITFPGKGLQHATPADTTIPPETSSAGFAAPPWVQKQARGRLPRPKVSIITTTITTSTISKGEDREPNGWGVLLRKSRRLRPLQRSARAYVLRWLAPA